MKNNSTDRRYHYVPPPKKGADPLPMQGTARGSFGSLQGTDREGRLGFLRIETAGKAEGLCSCFSLIYLA